MPKRVILKDAESRLLVGDAGNADMAATLEKAVEAAKAGTMHNCVVFYTDEQGKHRIKAALCGDLRHEMEFLERCIGGIEELGNMVMETQHGETPGKLAN
jgi:hypothetical protein